MIIIGIILLLIAGGLFWGRMSTLKKLGDITITETSQIGTLVNTSKAVAEEIGSGSFAEYAEIKGVAKTEQPLTAQFSGRECVYFRSQVIREWEEEEIERDSETGEERRHWERRSEVMSDNVSDPDFWIEDETGKINVHPKGAKIESIQVLDDFEQQDSGKISIDGGKLSWGNFSFSIGDSFSGRNILGYRFKEWIIPIDQRMYALGEASDSGGTLSLQKPKEKKTFLISTRSEEELTQAAEKSTALFTYGSIGCAVVGLILILVGIIR
ncbi:E3 ubiquitin ligase family protein [candidate division CSSED10-310 bacterium]|uniref:RING-type E3 ubiquitin transferase n=1 Tax=candidate division CSSED10-310 bacterium TaxID=2855610 RepID=A0ABV6YTW5_UNCC1